MEFILLKNYLNLPYCYFNLVYKKEHGGETINRYNFDIDGLNYIIDQSCELHDYAASYKSLDFIMRQYEKQSYNALDSLMLLNSFK